MTSSAILRTRFGLRYETINSCEGCEWEVGVWGVTRLLRAPVCGRYIIAFVTAYNHGDDADGA